MPKLKLFAGTFLTALFILPAFSQAQTIAIVSGDGQLVCPACEGGPYTYAPLVVQVNSSTGAPEVNATVTWTATQTGYQPTTVTSATNSSGQASFTPTNFLSPFFGSSFLGATVVASALNSSVTFEETTAAPGSGGAPAAIATLVTSSGSPPALSGAVGATSSTTIEITIFGLGFSGPIPGIALSLQAGTTGPTVSCAPQAGQPTGIVLTNSSGTATCTPLFGGKIGAGTYTVYAGGRFASWGPANLTVTAGAPGILKLVSSATQTVNPGVKASLVAEVTDVAGNPSNDAEVTWKVTEGTGTLSSTTSTSTSNGDTSIYVTPTVGPVQVTATLANNTAVQLVFTVNVNEVVTGITVVSGNNQQALEGAAFTNPLVVQVNDNTVPIPGATVTFSVASGSATLSSVSSTSTGTVPPPACSAQSCAVITNSGGQAQINVTAGTKYGPVVINASVAYSGTTFSQAFDLTVNPPGPILSSVVNAAGFAAAPTASPCSLVTIYGTGLATGIQGVVQPFIAPQYQVAGVTVQFGTPPASAPILYVANVNGQESLSVQVPCEVGVGTAVPLVVTVNDAASQPFTVNITPYSPGIFQFTDTDGSMRAVLVRSDGTLISLANPARPGDTLRMFVTGLGQTTPNLATDEFDPLVLDSSNNWVPQVLPVNAQLAVGIANSGVLIYSQNYADDMVGVYEVDFQVPQNAATGNNNVPFAIGVYINNATQLQFGNPSLIPIQ
jgi:uncharacterized protein (TIGR03437 family)